MCNAPCGTEYSKITVDLTVEGLQVPLAVNQSISQDEIITHKMSLHNAKYSPGGN